MQRKFVVSLAAALSFGCGNAFASVIDQVSPPPYDSAINTSGCCHWQQEVVVGIAGQLAGISLYLTNQFGGTQNDFNFAVNVGPAFQIDANDFSAVVSTTLNGFLFIDTTGASISLNVGDTFVIDITPIPSSIQYGVAYSSNDNYVPGGLSLDGNPYNGDIIFMSHMQAVPEPATLALVGLGLLALRLRRRVN